jgi:TRAP-type C4-dicarboxylate transport system permease small subunit
MKSIESFFKKILNAACFLLSISVTILMVTEIVARHMFEHAFRGLPEIYLLLVMWLYMLGASLASANRSHLRIGILEQLLPSSAAKKVYDLIIAVLSLIIMLYFIRWSWGLVSWGLKRPQTTPILLPSGALFHAQYYDGKHFDDRIRNPGSNDLIWRIV